MSERSMQFIHVATLLLLLADVISGSRILLLPYHWISTVNELAYIGHELQGQGHEVYVLLLENYVFLENFRHSFPDLNLITFAEKYPDYSAQKLSDSEAMYRLYVEKGQLVDLRENHEGVVNHCYNLLEDADMESKIRELQFDLVIMSAFLSTRCYFIFAYKLDLGYINVVTELDPWMARNPSLPSFIPVQFQMPALTATMSFWERIQNAKNFIGYQLYTSQVAAASDDLIVKYAPDKPIVSMATLAARALMWFYDSDLVLDYPRILWPNEIYIGGLSLRPPKPLSPDLEAFVASAQEGIIVASFGSISVMPEKLMLRVLDGLKMISPKFHILLRWHLPTKPPVPDHILLMDFLPQNDLLAHPKSRIFLNHAGANGQFEALSHAVPMINIPVIYDQMYNAKRADYHGFSESLDILTFTAEDLHNTIMKVLSDEGYKARISKAAAIFNSQPMSPRRRAVYWVEHVLRHGAGHLRSPALEMPTYQYLMLDLAAFSVSVVVSGGLLTYMTFRVFKRMIWA